MNNQFLFPFMDKGGASDCLSVGSGIWATNDSTANMPVNTYKYGILLVFKVSSAGCEVRMWMNNNGVRKIRTKAAGVTVGWSDF